MNSNQSSDKANLLTRTFALLPLPPRRTNFWNMILTCQQTTGVNTVDIKLYEQQKNDDGKALKEKQRYTNADIRALLYVNDIRFRCKHLRLGTLFSSLTQFFKRIHIGYKLTSLIANFCIAPIIINLKFFFVV